MQTQKPAIIVGGSKEFIQNCREIIDDYDLIIVGEADSIEEIYAKIDSLKANGVLVSSDKKFIEGIPSLVDVRKNVLYFVSGKLKTEEYNSLLDMGVSVLRGDLRKAMAAVENAFSRMPQVPFEYADNNLQMPPQLDRNNIYELIQHVLVVFYSLKGGVGKTTVATNVATTAALWAKNFGDKFRTAFLDFNIEYGNAKYSFGFSPLDKRKPRNVADFDDLSIASPLDAVLDCMNYHEKSNIYFLAAPETIHERDIFTDELAKKIIDITRKHFHFIFVDLGVAINRRDSSVIAMDAATDVVFIVDTDPDTTGLLYEYRSDIEILLGGYNRVRLVVNRVHPKMPFKVNDVARLLGIPLLSQLSESPLVGKAKVKGVPAVCLDRNSGFAREVASITQLLLGTRLFVEKNVQKRGLLKFWKGRKR